MKDRLNNQINEYRNAFLQLAKCNGNTRGKSFSLRPRRRGFKPPIRNHPPIGGRFVNRHQGGNRARNDTANCLVDGQQSKHHQTLAPWP